MQAERTRALSLYRNILRLHRTKLPPSFRPLGDKYLREEFKRHKIAKSQFLTQFFEWTDYYNTLKEGDKEKPSIGSNLNEWQVNNMSPEQKKQLEKLKEESYKNKDL